MNLITPFEVLKYSPAGFDYPETSFCELIPQIEEELARECLGEELYDYLVSKLSTYPTTATEYDSSVVYSLDDLVIRNGCTFVSTANSNSTDPIEPNSDWTAYERFTDVGVNELWTKYLRFLLALKVYQASIVFTTFRAGAGGLTVNVGDSGGSRSANKNEIVQVSEQLAGQIERTTANMVRWLEKNAVAKSIPLPECLSVCETPGRRSRRWGFKY